MRDQSEVDRASEGAVAFGVGAVLVFALLVYKIWNNGDRVFEIVLVVAFALLVNEWSWRSARRRTRLALLRRWPRAFVASWSGSAWFLAEAHYRNQGDPLPDEQSARDAANAAGRAHGALWQWPYSD